MPRRNTLASNRSRIVGPGENPNGFVSQTCNETVRAGNSEINADYPWGLQADGAWNAPMNRDGMTSPAMPASMGRGVPTVDVQPTPETVVRRRRG